MADMSGYSQTGPNLDYTSSIDERTDWIHQVVSQDKTIAQIVALKSDLDSILREIKSQTTVLKRMGLIQSITPYEVINLDSIMNSSSLSKMDLMNVTAKVITYNKRVEEFKIKKEKERINKMIDDYNAEERQWETSTYNSLYYGSYGNSLRGLFAEDYADYYGLDSRAYNQALQSYLSQMVDSEVANRRSKSIYYQGQVLASKKFQFTPNEGPKHLSDMQITTPVEYLKNAGYSISFEKRPTETINGYVENR